MNGTTRFHCFACGWIPLLAAAALMSGCALGSTRRVTPWLRVRRWSWVPDWGDSTRTGLPPTIVQLKGAQGWKNVSYASGGAIALAGGRHALLTTTNGEAVIDRAGVVVGLPSGCAALVYPDRRSMICVLREEGQLISQIFGDDGLPRTRSAFSLPPPPAGFAPVSYSPTLLGFRQNGDLAIVEDLSGPDALGPHLCRLHSLHDRRLEIVEEIRQPPGSPWSCHNEQTWPRADVNAGFAP